MSSTNKDRSDQSVESSLPDDSPGFLLAERVAYHMLERKAEDIVILDLRGLSDVCDFFVLGSAMADAQVRAVARAVRDGLAAVGQKPIGSEGEAEGRWALLDYIDVVVHVLKPAVRQYYQLERLWGDARALNVAVDHLGSRAFRRHHPDLAPPPNPPHAAPAE